MSEIEYSFVGDVVAVTGAARGIGKATAQLFAKCGAQVALVDRDRTELEQATSELKAHGTVTAFACDITDRGQLESTFAHSNRTLGPASILVNCAGMSARVAAENYESDDFDRLISLNVKALFSAMQICARDWIARKQPGVIVNIASIFGLIADPLSAPYAASKGAVIQLTKTCAVEWAPHGIRVNAVAPGYTRTAMTAATLDSEAGKKIIEQVPLRRAATVTEIANAIAFLASSAASFITGHTLIVDGGRTAG